LGEQLGRQFLKSRMFWDFEIGERGAQALIEQWRQHEAALGAYVDLSFPGPQ